MWLFWLTFCEPSGRLRGVLILDSATLLQARFKASVQGLDEGLQYCEGPQLDNESAELVPANMIGRMLSP